MKIGIFLGYSPTVKLTSEGLGRYIASLISGFLKTENTITIACPKWLEKELSLLFEDYKIDLKRIELITIAEPVAISFIMWRKNKKRKPLKPRGKFKKLLANTLFESITSLLSMTSMLLFMLSVLMISLLAIIISPILLIMYITITIILILKKIIRRPKEKIKTTLNKSTLIHIAKSIFTYTSNVVINPLNYMYNTILNNNISLLITKINNLKCVDIWYSPTIPFPLFNKIKGVTVLNVPDLVTSVFPQGFLGKSMAQQTENVRSAIQKGNNFITYSDFIKETLLIKEFVKKNESTKVINHAVNNLNDYIDIYSNTAYLNNHKNINNIFARDNINNLKYYSVLPEIERVKLYIKSFDFTDVRYIFYASQIRPHKNIITLLKAYKYILRKKYYQVKLILTGNYIYDLEVQNYILNNRLEYDVLSFSNVSSQMLASLYACSELVVNPTLYEGGFPFTFGEGMSVGTPSVMSEIPQVLEIMSEPECKEYLFNPYDWKDVADKIMFGLDNRQYLFDKQLNIYNKMNERTWDIVANEYIEAFKYFVDTNNEVSNDF